MRRQFAKAAFALVVALAGCTTTSEIPQQDYTARNGLRVFEKDDGTFEVIALPGTSGGDYFCAAGDFARVMRNARATERVIVTRPNGPTTTVPRGRSMSFRIGPPGPRSGGFITNVPMGRAGASFSVAQAQSFCNTSTGFGQVSTF
jgi:hypothetical protein